ncbi:MAG TPA: FAD/NAD(P)-binding oxidoreductase [Ktedonobacteraceae bacterium]|jgi:NADPH-dependent 2,4-dienoyl-CoA reductase/sulfur reductase-like enzyme|nr:FAD/NAD(P)-binding oxidoreductase [Ktedonobacteraceae bacterium]
MRRQDFSTLVIGAGPAGLAAATSAALSTKNVGLLDDNPLPGGQIWRQGSASSPATQAASWFERLRTSAITIIPQARVVAPLNEQALLVETANETLELHYERLILTTGARERFLPFPGWTLPGVMGAGGLQALVKGGLPVKGKRIVVAGSGPLLLAVASYLKSKGAIICAIAEQAPWSKLRAFGWHLPFHVKQLRQAGGFGWHLRTVPYYVDCWVTQADGVQQLEAVTFHHSRRTWTIPCDYLACGFGLVPNSELAEALGCEMVQEVVRVNEWQRSSCEQIYCAGEVTGIGGLDRALIEGRIAGFAASGQMDRARRYFAARIRAQRFADLLAETFQLRDELKTLAHADTLVCRCEDVPYAAVSQHKSWRSAKLQTRCGMGTCQGRICGAATDFLFGWTQDSLRAPLVPATVASLIASGEEETAR